jgi:hypothetical protein
MALYAVIDTIDHEGIREILARAVRQEERHVDFGERRTALAVRWRPALRRRLLGLSLVSTWAVRRLGRFLQRRLPADHPVLARLPEFLEFAVDCGQLRLRRMGIVESAVADLSPLRKAAAVVEAFGASLAALPLRLVPRRRLTDTYLRDPAVARPDAEPDRAEGPLHIVP